MSNIIAFPAPEHPLPDYTHHQGHDIVWEPWRICAQIICLGPARCEYCGSTETPLFAAGRAQPLPGQTFPTAQPRRTGHQEGMAVKQAQVPAWAVYRLCAFRCPVCGHVDILDKEEDYAVVDTEQPTLF